MLFFGRNCVRRLPAKYLLIVFYYKSLELSSMWLFSKRKKNKIPILTDDCISPHCRAPSKEEARLQNWNLSPVRIFWEIMWSSKISQISFHWFRDNFICLKTIKITISRWWVSHKFFFFFKKMLVSLSTCSWVISLI